MLIHTSPFKRHFLAALSSFFLLYGHAFARNWQPATRETRPVHKNSASPVLPGNALLSV